MNNIYSDPALMVDALFCQILQLQFKRFMHGNQVDFVSSVASK